MDHPTLMWFHDTWLGVFARSNSWIFTAGLVAHFVGISLVVGAMLIVDLRLMGLGPTQPIPASLKLVPVALAGFTINALTGFMFFCFDPVLYWENPSFKIKLGLLTLAGLNALFFTLVEQRHYRSMAPGQRTNALTKISAGLSLAIWFLVILFGRLIVAFQGSTDLFA